VGGRCALEASGNPYYLPIGGGLNLGYRRNERRAGAWVARRWVEGKPMTKSLDIKNPDSESAFAEALSEAKKWSASAGRPASITVREATERYLRFRDGRLRELAHSRAKSILNKYVLRHPIAALELDEVTEEVLRNWRKGLATVSAKTPTGFLSVGSIDKITKEFRPALMRALKGSRLTAATVEDGLAADVDEEAPNSRPRQLLDEETVKRIVSAAHEVDIERGYNGDLYRLVLVMAATGARFSQVQALTVGDVDRRIR
jgi:integrase